MTADTESPEDQEDYPNGLGLARPLACEVEVEAEAEAALGAPSSPEDFNELGQTPRQAQKGAHCLEFDSWWNEGSERRCVYIRYNIAEGAFQMAIDEDSNLYHVPLAYGARTGEVATVWDLHVGAELDILGRITTLQRCSQTTAQWNRYWAERLIVIRTKLVEELRKYETRKSEPWLTLNKGNRDAGSVNLRLLLSQVTGLGSQLREYRPRLAGQLGVPEEMYEIEDMPKRKEEVRAKKNEAK